MKPKIAKTELIDEAYYVGACRNATLARWDAERQVFRHWRWKFNNQFLEEIKCPEDETRWDVFFADHVAEASEITEEIPARRREEPL